MSNAGLKRLAMTALLLFFSWPLVPGCGKLRAGDYLQTPGRLYNWTYVRQQKAGRRSDRSRMASPTVTRVYRYHTCRQAPAGFRSGAAVRETRAARSVKNYAQQSGISYGYAGRYDSRTRIISYKEYLQIQRQKGSEIGKK